MITQLRNYFFYLSNQYKCSIYLLYYLWVWSVRYKCPASSLMPMMRTSSSTEFSFNLSFFFIYRYVESNLFFYSSNSWSTRKKRGIKLWVVLKEWRNFPKMHRICISSKLSIIEFRGPIHLIQSQTKQNQSLSHIFV